MEDKANEIKGMIPRALGLAMMLPRLAKLLAALLRDPRVPRYLKILTAGAVAYVGLPLDFLPDFVPAAGRIDDLLVILLILVQYMKSCPTEVFREHWNAIMGEDYNIEAEVRRAMEELDPRVTERFAVLKNMLESAAEKLALKKQADAETGRDAVPGRQTQPPTPDPL